MNRRQRKKYLKGNVGRIRRYIEHQINSGSGIAVTLPANLGIDEGIIWQLIREAQEKKARAAHELQAMEKELQKAARV